MPQSEKRSVLLVDDVELFLELEKSFFHRADFDLLMAGNAQEIMQLVLQRKPDLVFLEMQVSGGRGDDICRWIKQDRGLQDIPVIIVVAAGDSEAESLCRQAGCDDILNSPVRREQLLDIARRMLDLQDRRQQRISVRLPVQFRLPKSELTRQYSVDLSTGGMFIATAEMVPIDSELMLRLQLPDSPEPFACRCRVAWQNPPGIKKKPHLPSGIGVEFHELNSSHRDHVMSFLAQAAA